MAFTLRADLQRIVDSRSGSFGCAGGDVTVHIACSVKSYP
jgi:hypothetical protein